MTVEQLNSINRSVMPKLSVLMKQDTFFATIIGESSLRNSKMEKLIRHHIGASPDYNIERRMFECVKSSNVKGVKRFMVIIQDHLELSTECLAAIRKSLKPVADMCGLQVDALIVRADVGKME